MSNFKSQISLLVATEIGKLEGALRVRLNTEIDNQINKFLNQCPPPDVLENVGKVVSAVNGVLNLFESRINKFRALAKKLDPPISTATVSINILKRLPLPSATPPGVGIPVGVLNTYSDTLRVLSGFLESLNNDKNAILALTSGVDGIIAPIKTKVDRLNLLVEKCSESLSEEDRLALLNSLQSTSLEATEGISPVLYISPNGTPYTLQVILDPDSPQIAPRRQAIAKDTRGIVVLKGQPSFSSSIKVLLDELKLRIDNQLP